MAHRITDWDDAYANAPYIPDAEAFPPAWAETAAAFRAELGQRYSRVTYGPGSRQWMDVFMPETSPTGLAVFVHGGYWMRFDAGGWSHLASGALARGWAAVLPSYTLTPDATIEAITDEVARSVIAAAGQLSGPIALAGHSAGGHLVTRQVCDDTRLPDDVLHRIGHVLSISGVHDLRPLVATTLNETLKLTLETATRESPALLWPKIEAGVTCWVGGAERPEFRRQNALLANAWTGAGIAIEAVEAEGNHHYDVIDALTDPSSAMVERWLG